MEEGFVSEGRNRTDGNLPTTLRITLSVSVQVLELHALNVQLLKRLLFVPLGDRGRLIVRAFGLRENKPMGLVSEVGKNGFFFLLGAVIFRHRAGRRIRFYPLHLQGPLVCK